MRKLCSLILLGLLLVNPALVRQGTEHFLTWLQAASGSACHAALMAKAPLDQYQTGTPWLAEPARPELASDLHHIGNRTYNSFRQATDALRDGDTLYIAAGPIHEPAVVRASNIHLIGNGHTHISHTQAEGKAAIVVYGDNVSIENIECSRISVADGNGACVRHHGKNLRLHNVYFHDAEQGLLTGSKPGSVEITNSRFERLGQAGQAHGIYVGGGRLMVRDSQFYASRREGHEIKSRAFFNRISGNIVASLNGRDSRLIDIPDGGELIIENNVLEEGPQSSNYNLVGYALENPIGGRFSVVIRNNFVIVDRQGSSRFFHAGRNPAQLTIEGNTFVTSEKIRYPGNNRLFANREKAGIPPYPWLPESAASQQPH